MSEHVLHTVIVSYNRRKLLERTLFSYVDTVTLPHTVVVVDNGSEKATTRWLTELRDLNRRRIQKGGMQIVRLGENRYPGFAANRGFEMAPPEATLFHRSDNDMEYQEGWCDEVKERFKDPSLGLLGLRTVQEEGDRLNVGGNAVIRREVWDKGARYDERPWQEQPWEDGVMTQTVRQLGYRIERVTVPCAEHIGIASSQDPYYQQTFADRRITFAEWGVA